MVGDAGFGDTDTELVEAVVSDVGLDWWVHTSETGTGWDTCGTLTTGAGVGAGVGLTTPGEPTLSLLICDWRGTTHIQTSGKKSVALAR